MVKTSISTKATLDVETAACRLDQGLRALHAIALQFEDGADHRHQEELGGITGETLSVAVQQMSKAMLQDVRALLDIVDLEARHG